MTVRKREYKNGLGQQVWDYDFFFGGTRHRRAGFTSRAEAEIAETRAKQLVYSGKPVLRPSTFAEIVEPFLSYRKGRISPNTLSRDRRRMSPMLEYFGGKRLAQVTSADIDRYADRRIKEGMSPRSVNLEINLLSSIFKYAVSNGFAFENPARQVKRLTTVQVEQRIPSNDQFRALVEAAMRTETGLQLATWIVLRGYTGMRPSESFYLEWNDVDFDGGLVMVRPKEGNPLKNRKSRAIPMHDDLRSALLEWRREWERMLGGCRKPHDWVFINPRRPHLRCKRFEKSYLRAQRLAGLTEHMTSHCLRHFFISKAVESGVNFLVIAKWVGHSTTRMIEQVYAHLSPEFKNGEMKKIHLGLGSRMPSAEPAAPSGVAGGCCDVAAALKKGVDSDGA